MNPTNRTLLARTLFVGLAAISFLTSIQRASAQDAARQVAGGTSGQPVVIHIHHHFHFDGGSPTAEMANFYAPNYAWSFGYQPGMGSNVRPLNQNWGHLGFTGFLGQHGGGVDITPESLNVFTGLVVNTVTPDSPASKMGLVPGDFILKINGTSVDSYKQIALLFEQIEQGHNPQVDLTVWNPVTRRTNELKAVLDEN